MRECAKVTQALDLNLDLGSECQAPARTPSSSTSIKLRLRAKFSAVANNSPETDSLLAICCRSRR